MSVTVRENKFGRGRIIAIIAAVLILVILITSALLMKDSISVSLDEETKSVVIEEGESTTQIAADLKAAGVIDHPLIFKIQAKLGGFDGNMKPGTVTVNNGMSYNEILELLITPNRMTKKIVVPEGYEIRQIAQKLCEEGLADWDEFYDALNNDVYDYRFLQNLPERENKYEGYLFPATYEIPEGMSEHDIIDLMFAAFDSQFKDEYYQRAQEMGYSVDQIITMASVIERETDSDVERAKVAGVFYNRLNSGMKFQSCATVQYILGERKPVLAISDTKIDSPYNTYMYAGFPAGPIANPGIACIEAALYPETTDAYYFVQGNDGHHIFSATYEEHLQAMKNMDPAISVDSTAIENQDGMRGQ